MMRIKHQTYRLLLSALAVLFALSSSTLFYGCGEDDVSPPSRNSGVVRDDGRCGDGVLDAGEQCDDGNTVSGDGCSVLCATETGHSEEDNLVIEISTATLTAGSTKKATVKAILKDSQGSSKANETVFFSLSKAGIVKASAASAVTDANGEADINLTALASGQITVTAATSAVSKKATISVVPPVISRIESDFNTITAGTTVDSGALITVTVKDNNGDGMNGLTVAFSKNLGDLSSVASLGNGQYQTKLTSEKMGTAIVSANVLGAASQAEEITIEAGPINLLTLTANPNRIKKALRKSSTSVISIQAEDEFGNPVAADISLSTDDPAEVVGSLSEDVVALDATGKAEVNFVAGEFDVGSVKITATDLPDGNVAESVTIQVSTETAGEPANISISVTPANGIISVAGVGKNERASILVEVTDIEGNPIEDEKISSNLELEITSAPGNDEEDKPFLDGQDPTSGILILTTVNGQALANLQSGSKPGTVKIRATITTAKDGSALAEDDLISLEDELITIQGGPPASLILYESNDVQSPGTGGQGTISHDYLVSVIDAFGNPVPDGTAIYFGLFSRFKVECRQRTILKYDLVNGLRWVDEDCSDGQVAADGVTFTSASGQFITNKVLIGDTLALLIEDNLNQYGAYIIDEVVSETELKLETKISNPIQGIEYAVGNNKFATGAGTFPSEESFTKDSVARWTATYPGQMVNTPIYVHAETEGKNLGHAIWTRLPWAAPTALDTFGHLDKVSAGATINYTTMAGDASGPSPYSVADLRISVSANGGVLTPFDKGFNNSATSIVLQTSSRQLILGDPGGFASFSWQAPIGAVVGTKYKILVVGGGAVVELETTIQ